MSGMKTESFTIGPVILGYTDSPNTSLFTPKPNEQGKDTYGCTLMFNADVQSVLQAQIDAIGRSAFPAEWDNPNASLKRGMHRTLEKAQFAQSGTEFFVNVSSSFPPAIVDRQQQPIINQVDPMTGTKPIYDGVVAYVSVNVYSFQNKSKGVGIGIGPIMKYAEGNPLNLGGGVSVSEAFANVPAAPPAGAQAPVMGQPQPVATQPQPVNNQQPQPVNPMTGQPQPQPVNPMTGQPQPQPVNPVTGQPLPSFVNS